VPEVAIMRDPDQVRVPDVVPDAWVTSYRSEQRARRHDQLAREITRVAESSRRDSWILLAASGLCVLMLLVALGAVTRLAGMSVTSVLVVLAAFGTCLWLVHRCRRGSRSEG
jgi:Flp pilus assembly protein TadB